MHALNMHVQVTERPVTAHSLTGGPGQSDEPSPSEEFVLVYLMETHKLLTAADSHLKKPAQVSPPPHSPFNLSSNQGRKNKGAWQ